VHRRRRADHRARDPEAPLVIVGSLPTSDGTSATAKAGCLIILDSDGHVVETLNNAVRDQAALGPHRSRPGADSVVFVANVLNGTVAANGA